LSKDSVLRPVVWIGDSKKQLKKMPEDVQKQMGGELYLAQDGQKPPHSKNFKGIGSGVFEIKDNFDSNTYRLVYAVQIGARLYVLHAFQKKSTKGIATQKKDVDLIARRYKEAVEMEKEFQP
jgi:phage-related protein